MFLEPVKRGYRKARIAVDIITSGVHILWLEDERDIEFFQEEYHNLSAEEVFETDKDVTIEDGCIYDIEYYWVKENTSWEYPNEVEYVPHIKSAKRIEYGQ